MRVFLEEEGLNMKGFKKGISEVLHAEQTRLMTDGVQ